MASAHCTEASAPRVPFSPQTDKFIAKIHVLPTVIRSRTRSYSHRRTVAYFQSPDSSPYAASVVSIQRAAAAAAPKTVEQLLRSGSECAAAEREQAYRKRRSGKISGDARFAFSALWTGAAGWPRAKTAASLSSPWVAPSGPEQRQPRHEPGGQRYACWPSQDATNPILAEPRRLLSQESIQKQAVARRSFETSPIPARYAGRQEQATLPAPSR